MKKTVKYELILTEVFGGEVDREHIFKSYTNARLALRMRDFIQSIIDDHDYIIIPEVNGEFNQVAVGCEWCE